MQRQGSPPPSCNVSLDVVVTSSLFISKPVFPFSLYFSPLSHPFSISLALSLPLSIPPPPPFSSSSAPPPLSRVYCSRKSSTDTSMCVFVHVCVCVCATTVDPRAKLTRSWAKKEVRFNAHKKKPCVCVSNALIKTLIADALHHSHANKNP